jgi:hypothetical protein
VALRNLTLGFPCIGMPSDLRLPTACDRCDRIWLAEPGLEGVTICRFCAAPAHVFPGESYRAEDSALFEKIEHEVHAAQLSERTSQELWATLSNVPERRRRPDLLLLPVVVAIPALQFVREGFPEDRTQLSHAVGMILVVISAHIYALEVRQSPGVQREAALPHWPIQ